MVVISNRNACISNHTLLHAAGSYDHMYSRKVGISKTYRFYTKQVVFNKIFGVLNRTLYIPQVVHNKHYSV